MQRINDLPIGSKTRTRLIRDKIRWARHRIDTGQLVYCQIYADKEKTELLDSFRLGRIELMSNGSLYITEYSRNYEYGYFGINPRVYDWEYIELISSKVKIEMQLISLLIIFSYIRKV